MTSNIAFSSNEGQQVLNNIVKKRIPQWGLGLRPFQLESIPLILDNLDLFAITATGDGKSALFAIPILVHDEIFNNSSSYPSFHVPIRQDPIGIVVTPTKGLANNIVKELQDQFGILAFAYTHENISTARREGRDINKEIADCCYRIICVDPEHLREPEWIRISDSPKFCSNVVFGCAEEAHIIDEWGSTFRDMFRHIGAFFRGRLPSSISVFAITATMIPGTPFQSVCQSLGFLGPRFHLIRRSNECPNVQISFKTLNSALGGKEFSQLLPYLNQQRKTIIHVRTIELGYRIFVYLFRNAPQTSNRHHRMRMYHSLAPEKYNQKTIELLSTDPRCQIVIATKAFSLGIHAETLLDSITVGLLDTQCELDQCGGRVGRNRAMNARRIIFVSPQDITKAQKVISGKYYFFLASPKATSDRTRAQFLTEKTCRVSCLNQIYANPPSTTSYLDCIQAKRRLPCDLCRSRYNLLDLESFEFPPSPGSQNLTPFIIPSTTILTVKEKKKVDDIGCNLSGGVTYLVHFTQDVDVICLLFQKRTKRVFFEFMNT
ncbi:P-loop containing nucleoside triphosphate hydrolase protein [Dendrothele bispora CBS 962.96]|uniref:DNA 3'-5' helicase n=1 Tax=Dendrothele bispora (strain CBS 962.96) TaxID=1314807 RepID=A0A4S8LZQ2_DENBC|nr:P-loop containing nucleoside triphosphate hydrolase protein [Dendrothele bispora CBS 962.96]